MFFCFFGAGEGGVGGGRGCCLSSSSTGFADASIGCGRSCVNVELLRNIGFFFEKETFSCKALLHQMADAAPARVYAALLRNTIFVF